MSEKKIKRYRLFVDPKIQSRFILKSLILILFILLIFTVLLLYGASGVTGGGILAQVASFRSGNTSLFPALAKVILMLLILGGLWALWNLLRYTHKVVGPLVRLKKVLRDLGHGRLSSQIKFREDDELKELAELLTESMSILNQRIKTLQQDFEFVFTTLMFKNIKNLTNTDIVMLNNKIHKIKSLLKEFHTS